MTRARFLSLARSTLRLCLANHRAGYACDWLSIVWAHSEQETENGPRLASPGLPYTQCHQVTNITCHSQSIKYKYQSNVRIFTQFIFHMITTTQIVDKIPASTMVIYIIHHFILCIISNPLVNSNWSYSPEMLNSGRNWRYFILCDLEIWWMTLEKNRVPLLYRIKLCASFQSHRWSQTSVTVRKRPIRVKIGNFLSRVTLKFNGWPWKTIGHLSYAPSSFVHHFLAIGEFKLELQPGNAQFGSKSTIFYLCDLEIWRVHSIWSYSPETPNSGQNRQFFVPCDLEI